MFKKNKTNPKEFLDELESILGLMKKYQITQISKGDLVITKNIHLEAPEMLSEAKKSEEDEDDLLFHSSL